MVNLRCGTFLLLLLVPGLLASEPTRLELRFLPDSVAVGDQVELRVTALDDAGEPATPPRDVTVNLRRLPRPDEALEAIEPVPPLVIPAGSLMVAQTFPASDAGEWQVEASAEGLQASTATLVVAPAGTPQHSSPTDSEIELPENGRVVVSPEGREHEPGFDGNYRARFVACWQEGERLRKPPRAIPLSVTPVRVRKDLRISGPVLELTRERSCTWFVLRAEEPGEVELEVRWEGQLSEPATVSFLPPPRPSRLRFSPPGYHFKAISTVKARVGVELLTGAGKPWVATEPYEVRLEVEGQEELTALAPAGNSKADFAFEMADFGAYTLKAKSADITSGNLMPLAILRVRFHDEMLWWCLGGGLLAMAIQTIRAANGSRGRRFLRGALVAMAAAGVAFLLAHFGLLKHIDIHEAGFWSDVQGLAERNQLASLVLGLIAGFAGDFFFLLLESAIGSRFGKS